MYPKTVHQELTDLLFEAGCTISKPAIDQLTQWVRERDVSLINRIQKDADRLILQTQYGVTTAVSTDPNDNPNPIGNA